jgi:hypothetical protein
VGLLRQGNARLAAAVREREQENARIRDQLLELQGAVDAREVSTNALHFKFKLEGAVSSAE